MKDIKRITLTIKYPVTEEEEAHIKELYELLQKKKRGDYNLVANLLNIDTNSVSKDIERIHSISHRQIFETLQKVIKNREDLINNYER